MNKNIFTINCNSSLKSIINNEEDGLYKNFLINPNSETKENKILSFSQKISESNNKTFLKVKFCYGRRDKRIEVVKKSNELINLYKISSEKKLDRDAFELDEIIDVAKDRYMSQKIDFVGILVLKILPDNSILQSIQNNLSNPITFMSY